MALIHWWKLNEAPGSTTAVDSAGSANGTIQGSAVFTPNGKDGNGLFLSNSATAGVSLTTPVDLLSKNHLSFSFWFKRTALGTNMQFGKGSGGLETLGGGASGTEVYFVVGSSTGNAYGHVTQNDTNWHLWTMVYDGTLLGDSNRIKGFIDSVQQILTFDAGTPVPATTFPTTGTTFWIGNFDNNANQGVIDDCRIYNTSLSTAEVLGVFKSVYGYVKSQQGSLVSFGD